MALHLTRRNFFAVDSICNEIVKISKMLQWSEGQTISGHLDSHVFFIVYVRWRLVRLYLRCQCKQSAISARLLVCCARSTFADKHICVKVIFWHSGGLYIRKNKNPSNTIFVFQSTDTKNYQERMYAVAGICCGNLRHLELRTVYVWYKLFVIC